MSQNFAKNLMASLVIFLVALPLNLGIASACGLEPVVGLLSGIVAGIVVGALAGCPLQVSGPAAGLIAIVLQIISSHGIEMLGPVVLAAGVLQIILGASGVAPWFRAAAPSVIQGMLAGIGVLIFAGQFQVMLDQKEGSSGLANLAAIPGAIWEVVIHGNGHPSAIIGFLTIAAIVGWSRLPKDKQFVPGSLVGVAVGILAAYAAKPDIKYVQIKGDALSNVNIPAWEHLGGLASTSVLGSVLALAFIATAQTLLTATAIDRMHDGERTNYNREVMAQGAGNTICGLLGLLPISGVIVRSSCNVESGATGRTSAVLHGFWVLAFLVFFAPLLQLVPRAALAAVLVYTGYRLVNIKAIKELKKFGNAELGIYLTTLITVVVVNLLVGIVLGFVASAAYLIYTVTHCSVEIKEDGETGATILELRGSATFFTLPKLADQLQSLPPKREVHLFLSGLNHIDHACLEHILGWEELYIQQGGEVYIEWDHLIQRFKTPLTKEFGKVDHQLPLPTTRSHESYDVLAARANVLDVSKPLAWDNLADKIMAGISQHMPEEQSGLIKEGLDAQFVSQEFPVVDGVALPHLMVSGLLRHEMIVVQLPEPIETTDPASGLVETMVLLIGPKDFTEHLNILARLGERAEERLAQDLRNCEGEMSVREALLRHDKYVTVVVDTPAAKADFGGKALWQLGKSLPSGCLVAQIERDGESFVPGGSTVVKEGDQVLILGSQEATTILFGKYVRERELVNV